MDTGPKRVKVVCSYELVFLKYTLYRSNISFLNLAPIEIATPSALKDYWAKLVSSLSSIVYEPDLSESSFIILDGGISDCARNSVISVKGRQDAPAQDVMKEEAYPTSTYIIGVLIILNLWLIYLVIGLHNKLDKLVLGTKQANNLYKKEL